MLRIPLSLSLNSISTSTLYYRRGVLFLTYFTPLSFPKVPHSFHLSSFSVAPFKFIALMHKNAEYMSAQHEPCSHSKD
jgi:hypothetical protein